MKTRVKRVIAVVALIMLIAVPLAFAAATGTYGTVTMMKQMWGIWGKTGVGYTIDWTADGNGNVMSWLAGLVGDSDIFGTLNSVETISGLQGNRISNLPSMYNVFLYDSYGADFAGGALTARLGSQTQLVFSPATSFPVIFSDISLVINNASSGSKGRIKLFFLTL
jgi:hypothetical protein